jgi:hypothetical protein
LLTSHPLKTARFQLHGNTSARNKPSLQMCQKCNPMFPRDRFHLSFLMKRLSEVSENTSLVDNPIPRRINRLQMPPTTKPMVS